MDDLTGTTVKGYELRERIGAGGFGAIYKAYQSTVGREVAVKMILPGLANQPEFIRRFEVEAQLVARLEHLHITPLYDYWRDAQGAYLVMRWLRGGSLRDALEKGPYDLEAAALLLDQVCAGLSAAHRAGVIHRDLKPGNILLDEDGNAYLADFGIAKDLGNGHGEVTKPGALIGSPDYLAPEQARSEPMTPQTDIYSLGVVLYETLTGQHPFPGLTPVERLYKHLNEPLPVIQSLDPEVAAGINAVVQKATAKNPVLRYADAGSLAAAFREAAQLGTNRGVISPVEMLTPREQEVVTLLVQGRSNREIADGLVVELGTVKWYLNQIYRKLNVRSRIQAIVRARELDLIASPTTQRLQISTIQEPVNPYKGLQAFQTADERNFFGRERMVERLLASLGHGKSKSRFLAVVGPSGSGKSSLVKAGLIPALWRGELPGSERWFIAEMLPGSHPIDQLEVALSRVSTNQKINIGEQLQRDERGLLRAVQMILPDDGSELVLIVDQFEELFTLVDQEMQRQSFLALLQSAIREPRSRVRVVVTLRADFYDRPLHYAEFADLLRDHTELVLPLSAEELEQAIVRPAEEQNVVLEDGLAAKIVADVCYEPGALPLLQYALTELFERREGMVLTHAAYQAVGGTVGALAKRAEELYQELGENGQEAARQMFLRLVTLGEGTEDTRRRVWRSELMSIASDPDLLDEIIDSFAAYRLLSLDHDPSSRRPIVELAHEAILREWERLREWLDESREDIRRERQLAAAAREWDQAGLESSFLLSGSRLEQFETWAAGTELALTPLERDYLAASDAHRAEEQADEATRQAREARLEQRSRTVLRALVAVFALAALVSGGLALWANQQRQEALRQASIGLAARAEKELEGAVPERGVLLALEALDIYPYTPEAESALARTVEEYRSHRIFEGGEYHTIQFGDAAWSPDGTRVAADNVIWDAETGAVVATVSSAEGCNLVAVDTAWSPSGDRMASVSEPLVGYGSGSTGCAIVVWDADSGQILLRLPGDVPQANSVNWVPDGKTLVVGHEDGAARLWDAANGALRLTLSGHNGPIHDAAWSPDGTRIATAADDGTIRLWDAETGAEQMALQGHVGPVLALDWSPDSMRLATGGADGMPRVWDAASGAPILVLRGHTDSIVALDWSADGRRIATQSRDGTVRVWDAATGGFLFPIRNVAPGEGGYVAFSPDGEEILATNVDAEFSKVWAWDASPASLKLFGHTGDIMTGDWSPDGTLIATSSHDGTVRLWNAETGEQVMVLEQAYADFSDWSPDGTRLIVPGFRYDESGTVRKSVCWVWDVTTGDVLLDLETEEQCVFSKWSPDGSRIAVTTWDPDSPHHPTYVWDATSGERLLTLQADDGCMQAFLDWSPDSSKIVAACFAFGESGKNTPARVWDAATGQELMVLESADGWTQSTAWSPDGTRIAVGYEKGIVRIWDAETGSQVITFPGHSGTVFYVAWSPDGSRIASYDLNGPVKIWDPETAQEMMSFTIPGGEGTLHWSPDGAYLMATGGFNAPIIKRVWGSTEELTRYARECCVFRELTPEERQQFGLPSAASAAAAQRTYRSGVLGTISTVSIMVAVVGLWSIRGRRKLPA